VARYGMVIDLNLCVGCNACTIACKAEHGTPAGVFFAKVLEKEVGKYPAARRVFLPVLCNHCSQPACMEVCPSGATDKREDGIVFIDYDLCIGCRSCMEACPYGARTFHDNQTTYYTGQVTPFEKIKPKAPKGVVMKCDFCADRVDQGLDPACVVTCPTECRVFGDLDDPQSKLSRLIAEKKARPLLAEKGLEPNVFYIGS
jgi:molybdopterin-containing oxidoreductase family iron-sulfur binding subunit